MSPTIAMLAVAAARFVPQPAAEVLARSVAAALEYGEPIAEVVFAVLTAAQRPRAACRAAGGSAWLWPADVSPGLVAQAMIEAAS